MSSHHLPPCLLAIETSCDDTSVAVLKEGKILANVTAQQHIHSEYGGVVPELASRDHERNMLRVYREALKKAGVSKEELEAIAFTQGPGLLGSLLVGVSFAKSLALGLQKPLIAVDHLQAHIAALYIKEPNPDFPFLCLLVSGGHTQTVLVRDHFDFEVLGKTLDDAAGEAFDKIGKLMGIPYPGGALIDKYARSGNPDAFSFTYSKVPGFDYSFSGLKTQVLYFLQKQEKENPGFTEKYRDDLCASVQAHICTYLLKPVQRIMRDTPLKGLALAGGVSANSQLRKDMGELAEQHGLNFMVPDFEYCTDNAGMIAEVARFKFEKKEFADLSVIARARF